MDVFAVIAEPARRTVLDLLAEGPRPAGDLVARLPGLSQPAVSRHLRVLREAGFVRVEARGPQRIYSLDPAPLVELDAWIDRYRPYWAAHLDALRDHLDATEPEPEPEPEPAHRRRHPGRPPTRKDPRA
jgi:DNA-binding transcriptional ArsR family regulator